MIKFMKDNYIQQLRNDFFFNKLVSILTPILINNNSHQLINFIFTAEKTTNNNTTTTEQSCNPNPCGQHALCKIKNKKVQCSCQDGYLGTPPNCRPECTRSSDCTLDNACLNYKCQNPCTGVCGLNAQCRVINHRPVCACAKGFQGDPFASCTKKKGI